MQRFTLKSVAMFALGLMVLAGSTLGAQASSTPNKKQRRAERRSERRIVEPSQLTLAAVENLVASSTDVAVTWSDRGVPMAVYGKMGDFGGATEAAARSFLQASPELFRVRQDLSDLTLVSEKQTPGGTHLTFQQDYQGVKVFGAQLSVNFDPDGEVAVVGGDYFDHIDLASVEPTFSLDEARALITERVRNAAGVEPTLTELVVYVDAQGTAFLAHHVIQPTESPVRGAGPTYEFFVDAQSGTVIGRPRDINMYATGQVYKNGNAMAATGNSALKDTSTIPSTAYQTVTLQGLTSSTGLVGSHCDTNSLTAAANRATPDGSGNYTYSRSTTVSTGTKFDAVNLYYYVDDAQRYIQSLGFTNINNRSVRFNVNGTTDDNSWYQPNGSGTGDLTTGSGGVDDAEDGEVMLHEYGHSIHDNSKPGVWGGSVTGAMGEGWGDYLACSITSQRHGQAGTAYETTVMEWDASSYSSAVPPTIRSITSTKHYPESWANEVHADGEMWSSTLWQIRSDLIGINGTATGVQRADKVFLQSHFLMTSSSNTFVDGANAVLQAAINLGYTTAEQDAIRTRFTARGMAPTIGGGGCTYTISPTSSSPVATATTGTVSVTAGTGCTWTAVSNASWLTVTSGASGSGNGSVGYSVAANTGAARTGTLTIATKTFTVNQAAGSTGCSSSTTPITSGSSLTGTLATTDCVSTVRTTGTFYYDNFTFSATAGTAYTITLNAPFDAYLYLLNGSTVLASDDDSNGGTNSKIVYTPTTSGTLTIHCTSYTATNVGTYTVSLSGGSSCTYSISPSTASPAAGATTGTVAVTSGTGCAWTAASNAAWLTITSGASGSGNGTVGYSVAANTGASRTGTMTIAGQTFTVNQAGTSSTVLSEGAETGAAGWTMTTNVTGNNWIISTAGRYTGTNGFRSNAASTAYPNNLDQSLISPAFSLAGKTTATLAFRAKQQTETNYDFFRVEISTNGGSTWTSLSSVSTTSTGFQTTTGAAMVARTISLTPYVGQANVKIRFRLTSDTSVQYWGVALDDIAVTAN